MKAPLGNPRTSNTGKAAEILVFPVSVALAGPVLRLATEAAQCLLVLMSTGMGSAGIAPPPSMGLQKRYRPTVQAGGTLAQGSPPPWL